MITLEHLSQFCSTEDHRTALQLPFTRPDGHTYATDGRMMIRIPTDAIKHDIPESSINCEDVWQRNRNYTRFPISLPVIPDLPDFETIPCPHCRSKRETQCPECAHRFTPCTNCHGKGTVIVSNLIPIHHSTGAAYFRISHLRKLISLPDLCFYNPADNDGSAYFTFTGGEGILAQSRPEPEDT